eukprot:7049119-Pyramimonas_sp.AAC.1
MRQTDAPDASESVSAITSSVAPPTARVKYRKPTASLKITRTIRIVSRTYLEQQTEFIPLDATDERA